MSARRSTAIPKFVLALAIVLFHLLEPPRIAFSIEDDDLVVFEELLAIDEELDREKGADLDQRKLFSEAGVVSRAQRIVLELNNENAKKVVEENEYVLLLGYTPWCERSAELMPRFAEAATTLRELGSGVVMAKLDCERHTKAASLFEIKGFPALLLFVNGTSQSYRGGFTMEEIIIWTRKKTGAPTVRLDSVHSAKGFIATHQTYVVGFFKDYEGLEHREFCRAAISNNEIQFADTSDMEVVDVLFPGIGGKDYFLGLVKNEPERLLTFDDDFKEEKILHFIELNKFPLLTILTEDNSNQIYSSLIKLQVFVIADPDNLNQLRLFVQDVARKYMTKILFIYVNSEEENLAKPFLTLFGVETMNTVVVAFDGRNGSKYLLQSDFTRSNLEEFCNDLLAGSLQPYFRSESVSEKMGSVETVVGRTFGSIVLQSEENVFLEVHTPWCMDCKAISKKVEKLAGHFRGRSNVIIARINAASNEHPKLQVTSYPTLLFYPSGDKSNPIKLSKKSRVQDWITFIEKFLHSNSGIIDQVNRDEL